MSEQDSNVLTGACLCGGVRYEVEGPLTFIALCHCTRCRRQHGTAPVAWTAVPTERFRLVQGQDLLKVFPVEGGVDRTFCSTCGSSLFGDAPGTRERVEIAVGSFEGDPQLQPMVHVHVASKAPWYEIADDLPQIPAGPED